MSSRLNPANRKVTFTGRNVLTLQDGKHTTFKVISGLAPGTYTFKVAAVNEGGGRRLGDQRTGCGEIDPVSLRSN